MRTRGIFTCWFSNRFSSVLSRRGHREPSLDAVPCHLSERDLAAAPLMLPAARCQLRLTTRDKSRCVEQCDGARCQIVPAAFYIIQCLAGPVVSVGARDRRGADAGSRGTKAPVTESVLTMPEIGVRLGRHAHRGNRIAASLHITLLSMNHRTGTDHWDLFYGAPALIS